MPNTNHVTHTPNEATYLIINNIFMSDTYSMLCEKLIHD